MIRAEWKLGSRREGGEINGQEEYLIRVDADTQICENDVLEELCQYAVDGFVHSRRYAPIDGLRSMD